MSFGGESTNDYVNRIILETVGAEKLDDFNRGLDRNAAGADRVSRALGSMSVTVGATSAQMGTMARSLDQVEQAQHRVSEATEKATKSSQRFNYAAIELSRGLEDLAVAGPLGALNNLARFSELMAGPGGLAVGVSLAGTAAYVLYRNWDQVNQVLGTAATRTEAERMEELGRKTHKTVEEQREFNKLKKEQAELDRLDALRSQAEKEGQQAVEDVIGEAGGAGKIAGPLAATRIARGVRTFQTPAYLNNIRKRDAIARRIGPQKPGTVTSPLRLLLGQYNRRIREQEQEMQEARVNQAKEDIRQALTDPAKLRALAKEVEAAPGAFPKGLAGRLLDVTPEERERQLTLKLQGEQQDKEQLKGMREREQARRETEALDERTRLKGVADREKATQEESRRLAHLSTQYGREIGPAARVPILRDIRAGADLGQTADRLRGQVASNLAATPGFDPRDAEEVARRLIAQAVQDAQEEVAGSMATRHAGRPQAAASDLLRATLVKGARGERREAAQEGRDVQADQTAMMADQIRQATGLPIGAAMQASHRTMQLTDRGFNQSLALSAAVAEIWGTLRNLEAKANFTDQAVRQTMGGMRMRRGTVAPRP